MGIRDDLVRLSVGCEAYEDLRQDLEQALESRAALVTDALPSSTGDPVGP